MEHAVSIGVVNMEYQTAALDGHVRRCWQYVAVIRVE